jgi:hypothetical protein
MGPECQYQMPDVWMGGDADGMRMACGWRLAVDCGVKIGHMAERLPDAVALAKQMSRNCRSAAGGAV